MIVYTGEIELMSIYIYIYINIQQLASNQDFSFFGANGNNF